MGKDCCEPSSPRYQDDPNACAEYRELTRRAFLRMAKTPAVLSFPAWLPRVVLGSGERRSGTLPHILMYVFERGGKDGWASVAAYNHPYWTTNYTTAGGTNFPFGLRPVPGQGGDLSGIGLDVPDAKDPDPYCVRYHHLGEVNGDLFGINKAYLDRQSGVYANHDTLYDLYQAGEVAFIPCAGSPDRNRSHFEAEALIEYGVPNQLATEVTGWLTRYLMVAPSLGSPLRAAAFTQNNLVPKMLTFAENTMAFQAISNVVMPGNPATQLQREAILRERYEEQTVEPLTGSVLTAIETADLLSQVEVTPHPEAYYTNSDFGQRCMNAAALVKAGIDIEMIVLETYGHDTHAWEGPYKVEPEAYADDGTINLSGGGYYNRVKDFSQNITALRIDCQDFWNRICLVAQPEFGRQVDKNGDNGTDHANAGLMTVMGGAVSGGVYCKRDLGGVDGWPSLDPDNMAANHDQDGIRTTLDYRVVISEILRKCLLMSQSQIDNVIFPTVGEEPPPTVPFDQANEIGVINAS